MKQSVLGLTRAWQAHDLISALGVLEGGHLTASGVMGIHQGVIATVDKLLSCARQLMPDYSPAERKFAGQDLE